MSEYKDNNNYEPNFILQSAKPAGDGDKADDAKADAAEKASMKTDAAEKVIVKADAIEETAAESSAADEAAAKADVAAFLAEADAEAEGAKKTIDVKSTVDAADTAAMKDAAPANVEAARNGFEAANVEAARNGFEAAKAEAAGNGFEAADTEAARSIPAKESPATEVLRAAAAKADALKAVAAKADPANEPYRRETSAIKDPVYSGASVAGNGFVMRDVEDRSSVENDRPRFENPSFDPGQTGRYTDPREKFRGTAGTSASASWSNGEVHRSRKQMKDQLSKQKKQRKASQPIMLTRRSLGLLIAGCLLLSCLFGLGGAALGTTLVKQNQANTAQTTTAAATPGNSTATSADYTLENATDSSMTIKEITSAAKNSVVEIRTESVASDTWMQQYVTQGAGSGVIISDDGYIMTNNHVIEGASKITVTTADEKEYQATLVGTDETNDVAVIKINASGLTPATYGNSDQLEVGDMAVAIGNPLGELGGTVTAGIISATDRELSIDGKTMHLLQTDSSINPGNSGGGLFNGSGQLIGLVVAKSSGSDVEGLGFAIPINTAADVAKQLIDKGYVSGQPSTGMTYQEGTTNSGNGSDPFSSFDSFFGSGGSSGGVFIYSVNGENAKAAGFQSGDQVFAVDDKEISTFDELSSIITSHKVGDKVTFTIIRNGEKKKIKLELEEKANVQQDNGQSQNEQNEQNGQAAPDQNDQNNIYDGGQSWQDFFNSFF